MKPCLQFQREGDRSTLFTLAAAIAEEWPDSEAERLAAAAVVAEHLERRARGVEATIARRLEDLSQQIQQISNMAEDARR